MAQLKDLIITSTQSNNVKTFIRIGDTTPSTVDITGSSILFLQDLSTSDKSFDTANGTSAFRIRHDTVGGYLVFEGRSGSNGPFQLMTLNDDTNTVTFGGVVSFLDIIFDEITGSHLYIATSSRLLGTTSISFLSMTSSLGTASIWYDGTLMHIDGFTSGGNSWKTLYKLTESWTANTAYSIYTNSVNQLILYYPYLSVFVNGDALIQSSSTAPREHWDYQPEGSDSYSIKFRYNLPVVGLDLFYITYMYNGGEH